MNKIKELEQKVKELQEEIDKLKSEETSGRWQPSCYDTYYYIATDGTIGCSEWGNDEIDFWRYNNRKIFKTEEECKQYRKFIEDVNKYKWEFTDEEWEQDDYKYSICYDYEFNHCGIVNCISGREVGCVYFKTEEDAQYIINNYKEEILRGWL